MRRGLCLAGMVLLLSTGCGPVAPGGGQAPTKSDEVASTPAKSTSDDLNTAAYRGKGTCKLITREQAKKVGLNPGSSKAKQFKDDQCSFTSGTFGYDVGIDQFANEGLKSVDAKAGKPQIINGHRALIGAQDQPRNCLGYLETSPHEVWSVLHSGDQGDKDGCDDVKKFMTEMVVTFETRPSP